MKKDRIITIEGNELEEYGIDDDKEVAEIVNSQYAKERKKIKGNIIYLYNLNTKTTWMIEV